MLVALCLMLIVGSLVLHGLMPAGYPVVKRQANGGDLRQAVSEIHSAGPVRINEIMTANGSALTDSHGETSDWAEIANIGRSEINLKGYLLARNAKAGNVFVFPDITLQPGQCVLVYCDGRMQAETGEELHAPFRMSATGDVLMLFNKAEVAIDTVNVPAMAADQAYVRTGTSSWEISSECTPGVLNTDENRRAMSAVSGSSEVQIVELMASSDSYAPDENGLCHDYVILRNISGADADIGGWYLSDTPQQARMWRFPNGTIIPPGGTITVHCSGLNRVEDPAHLHTSFKLASEGEQVVLSNAAGQPMDMVTYDLLKTDAAYVRASDGSWSVAEPTAQKVK